MIIPFLAGHPGRRAFKRLSREVPLGLMFEKFHQLLEFNNRVLEIIAEMEEMVEGEYIFDKSYIQRVRDELSLLLSRIVYNLNVVGQGRHMELFQVYENIKQKIELELTRQFQLPEGECVIPLKSLDQSKSDLSGNKAAILGELRSRVKIAVPPGFAITTRAYERLLETEGLREKIEGLLEPVERGREVSLDNVSAQLEHAILHTTVPSDIVKSIEEALDQLDEEWKEDEPRYAVRSSAVGEDAQLSFAGQYSTFLNVPRADIIDSYKKVVASLFCPNALAYRRKNNISYSQTPMAVAVIPMLNPVSSGIIYSEDPNSPTSGNIIISAVWGLGQMVAEGEGKSDYYVVARKKPYVTVERSIAGKREAYEPASRVGVMKRAVPGEKQQEACLSDTLLPRLADLALRIEGYFGQPQDIEWALDAKGIVSILQARPLLLYNDLVQQEETASRLEGDYPVLMKARGVVACRGLGAGKAYHVFPSDSGANFPEGAVLVARSTSPRFSTLISRASAVVTDIGTPTGHMATIARECRVPMIVDTGIGTRALAHGQEVTVDANNNVVYAGLVEELVERSSVRAAPLLNSAEFRKLRAILKHIAPLHLTDPRDESTFRASKCESYHDIIRFSHEMIVKELIEMNLVRKQRKASSAKRLNLELPIGLILLDVGGGIQADAGDITVELQELECIPLKSVLEGLLMPGMWSTEPVPLSFRDFVAGMGHTGELTLTPQPYGSRSLAIVSNSYLNLSLRFGYHFTMVDCVASPERSANYIYFRFVGGITEMARRKRRAEFLCNVLNEYDFSVNVRGDLVLARITKMNLSMMKERLVMLGRLIGFSRQLDILMGSQEAVDNYTKKFLEISPPLKAGEN